jgi:hypothetical protein
MMKSCRELVEQWGGGTVILSPRDLEPSQLLRFSREVLERSGEVLLDPQIYIPHEAHFRLASHDYWPGCSGVCDVDPASWQSTLAQLIELNHELGAAHVILPGVICPGPSDLENWRDQLLRVADAADALGVIDTSFVTVALGRSVLADSDCIHDVLDTLDEVPFKGSYVVLEHPAGEYLVTDPVWLSNALDLAAGCALRGGPVIVGYCSQQMLVLGAAGVSAIASGSWGNLRHFGLERFRNPEAGDKQRTIWYYSPPTLSEYKVTFLDVAAKTGSLLRLHPSPGYPSTEGERLFTAPRPTSAAFSYGASFHHYLTCMRHQARMVAGRSYADTHDGLVAAFDDALGVADEVAQLGVKGQHKQLKADACDATTAALAVLRADRMPVLSRTWPDLGQWAT